MTLLNSSAKKSAPSEEFSCFLRGVKRSYQPSARQILALLGIACLSGCAVLRPETSGADLTRPTGGGALPALTASGPKSPARLQLEVMDFSDRYVNGMWTEIDAAYAGEPNAAKRVAALTWKLRYGSASMEIASGADPRTNLLDMAVFISTGKWAMDRYWVPEIFGDKADGLRRHYQEMDRLVWELVAETLTDEQTALLRTLVDEWLASDPRQFEVSAIRFRNLEGVNPEDFRKEKSARGLLASVRRWLGEVNTSLLFGERVLFYVERTPRIINQQTDLTMAQIANDFPLTTLNPDFNAMTGYLHSLPEQLRAGLDENQGIIKDVLPGVAGTITDARELVTSSTQLVASATELSSSLNASLDRINALAVTAGNAGAPPIDYQATLAQAVNALASLDSSVNGLNQLLATDDAGGSKLSTLAERLDSQTDRMLDRAFERAIWLMGIFFGGIAALLILARLLFPRRAAAPTPSQPAKRSE
jgi:hypothetical protein